jgi:hypothetical protein
LARAVANHPALIRSFLIDSGLCHPLLYEVFSNFFHSIDPRDANASGRGENRAVRAIHARLAPPGRRCGNTKMSISIAVFYKRALWRCDCRLIALFACADAPSCVRCWRRRALCACAIHVSLSGDCFFRCAGVNQMQCVSIHDRTNATPAMIYMARRAAMAKRKKAKAAAKKTAKKTKKRKKKL